MWVIVHGVQTDREAPIERLDSYAQVDCETCPIFLSGVIPSVLRLSGQQVVSVNRRRIPVSLNGEIQQDANPFVALRSAMDVTTWRRVGRVLEETLNPAAGGDQRLFSLLRRSLKASRERQAS
jgi:hypothetical protein